MVNDWLGYPDTLTNIETMWTSLDYLYFSETTDTWYYRLTREDLTRSKIGLNEFLMPVYKDIKQTANFDLLLKGRTSLLSEISNIKTEISDRIRDPKRLRDLWSRSE